MAVFLQKLVTWWQFGMFAERTVVIVVATQSPCHLRHYTTSQKVMGSIPDEVTRFLNLPKPSSHIMTLGLTQPLTEMNTRNIPEGLRAASAKGRRIHRHL
jgi:hypothetical protein